LQGKQQVKYTTCVCNNQKLGWVPVTNTPGQFHLECSSCRGLTYDDAEGKNIFTITMAPTQQSTPTSEANIKLLNKMFSKLEPIMVNFAARWKDEGKYENITDYETPIKSELPKSIEFLKMTKRPFGFTFGLEDKTYAITISGRNYQWKRLS